MCRFVAAKVCGIRNTSKEPRDTCEIQTCDARSAEEFVHACGNHLPCPITPRPHRTNRRNRSKKKRRQLPDNLPSSIAAFCPIGATNRSNPGNNLFAPAPSNALTNPSTSSITCVPNVEFLRQISRILRVLSVPSVHTSVAFDGSGRRVGEEGRGREEGAMRARVKRGRIRSRFPRNDSATLTVRGSIACCCAGSCVVPSEGGGAGVDARRQRERTARARASVQ
jgi:hypothetical protein